MSGVIGQRVLRLEDARFLEGKGSYVDNLELPGARHVTFVRSPFAHARITGIDVSAALAVPDVQVFTAADVDLETFQPPPLPGLEQRMGRPYVASETVRFNGDIVAIVVSESRVQGMDAAALVAVDYDPLPAVVDPREALADRDAPVPGRRHERVSAEGRGRARRRAVRRLRRRRLGTARQPAARRLPARATLDGSRRRRRTAG